MNNNIYVMKNKNKRNASLNVLFKLFKKDGVTFLETQTETTLVEMIVNANKMYYNEHSTSPLTDNEFDVLKEYTEKRYPKNMVVKQIGAPVKRNKVRLPYEMWSMDKIKPSTNAIEKYLTKYKSPKSYILSTKLDGVSGMYSTEGGVGNARLYTRGDGKVGQDVSHMIPYLRLPKSEDNIVIRGEFIMKKSVFRKYYKDKKTNARNVVSGIVNKIKINPEEYGRLSFVAYEVISPTLTPKEQFRLLEHLDVEVCEYMEQSKLSNDYLSSVLLAWRENYEYEIDGVICTHNKKYSRVSKNPEHSFAFKMVIMDQKAEAKVVDVLWSPSKDGYLKPRIQIEPVELQGVTIEYATGFNAAFVKQNGLGVGALVELVRSGDVIPYITNVIQSASVTKWPDMDYVWNDTKIDILLEKPEDNDVVKQKNIALFFKKIGVEGLSEGNVRRIYEGGYTSISMFLSMSKSKFLKIEGFKEKMATKLHTNIHTKIADANLLQLMVASNVFGRGFGEKKLEVLLSEYPSVFQDRSSKETKMKKVAEIEGFANKTAESFVSKIEDFKSFLREIGQMTKLNRLNMNNTQPSSQTTTVKKTVTGKYIGKKFVFTGFRDKELEEKLKIEGGQIMSSVSGTTDYLVVKTKDQTGSKVDKAKLLSIPVIVYNQLM
jgi:DNA ligase (NAD+)